MRAQLTVSRVMTAFGAGVCAFVASALPLAAQARDTAVVPVPLPALEVTTSILPVAGPAIGSGVPARVTIVPGSTVGAWQGRLLSDALIPLAGVSLYDDLGSPFKTTLVTRGFAASPVVGLPQGVSVFIDGIPLNEPDARQVNFDLLPLGHVARVEVLSGTAALLGPNALGGAVNLVTRSGAGRPGAEVEAAVGSFGSRSADASFGGAQGDWSYYAGGGYETEEGWRELTGAERYGALFTVGRLASRRGIRLSGFASRAYAETAGSLPLSVYRVDRRVNLTAGDFEDLSQIHVALSGYAPAGAGRGAVNVYLRGHDAERFNVNQSADPDVRSFSENRTLGLTADWRWSSSTGGRTLGLRVGAAGSVNRTDVRIFAERIDPGMTTHVRSPISDGGVFGIADYVRGRFTASGGVRLDGVRIPFRNMRDAARDTTSHYVELNPRGGVSWNVGGGRSVYASIGRSFRAPAVIELACADPENPCPLPFALGDDPPLDPVTAVTYEIGGRWDGAAGGVGFAAFRTDVTDDIFLFPYDDAAEPVGSTIDGYFANIAATRRAGVELDSRLTFGRGHSAYLNYAFTSATFQVDDIELFSIREEQGSGDNEVGRGDRMPLVPDHVARAGADFLLHAGLELGVAGRYTGRRWLRGDEANEEPPLASWVVLDARASYDFGGWTVQLTAHNVLDARYAAFGTFNIHQAAGGTLERFLTPGPPREVRLVLRRAISG